MKISPVTRWWMDRKAAFAIRALEDGTASKSQQQYFVRWLVQRACLTYEDSFQPGKPDLTNYYLGRQSIGKLIVMHLRAKIKEETDV